jgi:hypothetical protein
MQLVDTLAADTQDRADGGKGLRGMAVEAVVGDDDVTEAGGELSGQVVQSGADLSTIESVDYVDVRDPERVERVSGRETVLEGNGTPDGVGDGRHGVRAEGGAALRIVVAQGRPQTDAALVQGILEGKRAQPLAPDDPVDEPLVLGHLLSQNVVTPISGEAGILTHGGASLTG